LGAIVLASLSSIGGNNSSTSRAAAAAGDEQERAFACARAETTGRVWGLPPTAPAEPPRPAGPVAGA
jgi:hypothetical protein